jgi:hypothetical protein
MATVTKSGISTIVSLDFKGYYQEKHIGGIQEVDGIYAAFACTLSKDKDGVEYCTPLRCIYIGMGTDSDNVHVRVAQHNNNDHDSWKKHMNEGEYILYSYAECQASIVHDVEAALIFANQPIENDVSKNKYTGSTHFLTVNVNGRFGTLRRTISVI